MLEHTNSAATLPKRIVVVGGNGFIGRVLVPLLEADGAEVVSIAGRDLDLSSDGAAEKLAARMKPDDAVVFLSALTPDRGRDIGTFQKNIDIAVNVVRACEAVPPAHMIYLSSDAVYDMIDAPVTEETPPMANDLYGAMHRAREVMIQQSIKAPVAVLRCTLVLGAGDPHNSYGPNRFRRMAKDGEIRLFGGGEETRDFVDVTDVAGLIKAVLARKSTGILNLARGQSFSFFDLAEKVAAQFNPPAKVQTTERNNPITHRVFDTSALTAAFPDFAFLPLDEALATALSDLD